MDDDEILEIPVEITNELEENIAHVFQLFDHQSNKTVKREDVGTIMRALGSFPSEKDVAEFQPASGEAILASFRAIDEEGRGYIPKDYFIKVMTQYGEPFSKEEVEEMCEVGIDPSVNGLTYEFFIKKLMFTPKIDLFAIADAIEAAKPPPPPPKKRLSSMFNVEGISDA
ncbi:hypothetical protein FQA39_LY12678 [Lamprigera yunnana]|nr:hypothetical protein FQA39_LY12678 [Lamprigera yunnana]